MSLKLTQIVPAFLKEYPEQKFTAREIAEWIFNSYPTECHDKRSNSRGNYINSDKELIQQIVAEISSIRPGLQAKDTKLKTTEERPRKYYYSERSESDEVEAAEQSNTFPSPDNGTPNFSEHDLYPLLSQYLWEEFGIFSKRIDEKTSSNKRGPNGNRWLHPDVVGMEDLGKDWHPEVCHCVKWYPDKRTRLWSFEVKKLINGSNVRECFFQTVSNSSWANFGYLVTTEISTTGADTMKELRMLSAAHGIGVIQLDVANPGESQILIPARERDEINWDTVNRLVQENPDFQVYIQQVQESCQLGKARWKDWDIPEQED